MAQLAGERAKHGRLARSMPSRFLFEAQGDEMPDGWVGIEAKAVVDEGDDLPADRGKKKAGRGKAASGKRAGRRPRPR